MEVLVLFIRMDACVLQSWYGLCSPRFWFLSRSCVCRPPRCVRIIDHLNARSQSWDTAEWVDE